MSPSLGWRKSKPWERKWIAVPRLESRHARNAQQSIASSEPGVEFRWDVAVQKHLHAALLLAREFADLQASHVGRSLPIHVMGAFKRLVRPDAVEVLP